MIEDLPSPALVIADTEELTLANTPARLLFGMEASGAPTRLKDLMPPFAREPAREDLRQVREGREKRFSWVLRRLDEDLALEVWGRLRPVGSSPAQAVVVVVEAHRELRGILAADTSEEFRFVIHATPQSFGEIVETWQTGPGALLRGQHCFQGLYGADAPCPRCPAATDRSSAIEAFPRPNDPAHVVLCRAERIAPDLTSIAERFFDARVLGALLEARFEQVALLSGLSIREREVLRLIVLGRSYKEIAGLLGIAERTVRFHVSNLLNKLGADSRADLLRVLL